MVANGKFWAVWEEAKRQYNLPDDKKAIAMFREMLDALVLFAAKQSDYSSLNIKIGGEEGVFIRALDKMMRLVSYYRLGRQMKNENIDDTWKDLAVYAFIALLVRKNEWNLTLEEKDLLGLW